MNKEEILKKSRNENRKRDEMEISVHNKSLKWTYVVLVLTASIFTLIRDINGQPMMDLSATVCFSIAAGNIYKFIKLKDKFYLIIFFITLAVGIFATVRFFMGH